MEAYCTDLQAERDQYFAAKGQAATSGHSIASPSSLYLALASFSPNVKQTMSYGSRSGISEGAAPHETYRIGTTPVKNIVGVVGAGDIAFRGFGFTSSTQGSARVESEDLQRRMGITIPMGVEYLV